MVNVGFIVEGDSEKIMVESASFEQWLNECGYQLARPVINAKGGGNLLPDNIQVFLSGLHQAGADRIVVLTDLERETSVAAVKERISSSAISVVFVAVKALEAWFMADTEAMRRWLKAPDFFEASPERTPDLPWQHLKHIAKTHGSQGPGNKVAFAKRFTRYHAFDITQAAQHPACPSAQELVMYFGQPGQSE